MKLSLIVSALAFSITTGGVLADQDMPMQEQMEEMPMQEQMPMQKQMQQQKQMSNKGQLQKQQQMPMSKQDKSQLQQQKQMGNKGQLQKQQQIQKQDQELVYGSQLMTQQERIQYRAKMRAATTAQEREQIRNEHHQLMKARAQERGVTLPDEPPAGGAMRGNGMGPGSGTGMGGGSGAGMGAGKGNKY